MWGMQNVSAKHFLDRLFKTFRFQRTNAKNRYLKQQKLGLLKDADDEQSEEEVYTTNVLFIYLIITIYLLYIYYIFTVYLLYIYYIFTVYLLGRILGTLKKFTICGYDFREIQKRMRH